jgi:glycosyltransferase involved in cell wall biosynthesis
MFNNQNIVFDVEYIPIVGYWTSIISKIISARKVVYTLHDPIPHSKKTIWMNHISHRMIKKCDQLIMLSSVYKKYISNKYDIKTENITIIPLANQSNYVNKNINKVKLKSEDNVLELVFFGRITQYKGLDILAEAYSILSKEFNSSLSIVGNGDFSKYEHQYHNLPNVKIINEWIKDDKVNDHIGQNKIIVLPYTSATQSGIVPLAMQLKSLVVASNVGGIPEQIKDGITGILVKPNNPNDLAKKIKEIYLDKNKREKIIQSAYQYVDKLNWKQLSTTLLNVMKN